MADKVELPEVPGFKNIGEVLKKKREERSYTLEHVSEVTCITLSNLRNLEEGNLDDLPGPVFVKGFIKNYARFLKIESDWMIEALDADDSLGNHASMDYNAVGSQFEASRSQGKSNYKYVVAGVMSLALLLGLFWWNDNISSYLTSDKEALEAINALETKNENQKEVINNSQAENSVMEDDRANGIQAENSRTDEIQKTADINLTEERKADKQLISPLNLILVANESRWIRLTIDDKKPFDLLLNKGERYSWPAQEEYFLIMSSGGVASIHLNGEEILDRETFMDQLYQVKLNKFTLKQINNR